MCVGGGGAPTSEAQTHRVELFPQAVEMPFNLLPRFLFVVVSETIQAHFGVHIVSLLHVAWAWDNRVVCEGGTRSAGELAGGNEPLQCPQEP